jgi:hypothetical protein
MQSPNILDLYRDVNIAAIEFVEKLNLSDLENRDHDKEKTNMDLSNDQGKINFKKIV